MILYEFYNKKIYYNIICTFLYRSYNKKVCHNIICTFLYRSYNKKYIMISKSYNKKMRNNNFLSLRNNFF